MSENNKENISQDENKSQDLLTRAFRFPKFGMLEKLTCQRMLQATFSTHDSVIIDNVTAAVLMMEPQATKQNFETLNFPVFHTISKVSAAILNVATVTDRWEQTVYKVPLSLEPSLENWQKNIAMWFKGLPDFWGCHIQINTTEGIRIFHDCGQPLYTFGCYSARELEKITVNESIKYVKKRLPNQCPRCREKIYVTPVWIYRRNVYGEDVPVVNYDAPTWNLFFESLGCLTYRGFKELKSSFETWAKPICMNAINILSNLISPATYDEMLKIMGNKDQQKEAQRT